MKLFANWNVCGIVTEKRELTSKKNADWRGYIVKVATLGESYEIQTTPEQYKAIGDGEHIECTGKFEEQNNKQRFVLDNWKSVSKKEAA